MIFCYEAYFSGLDSLSRDRKQSILDKSRGSLDLEVCPRIGESVQLKGVPWPMRIIHIVHSDGQPPLLILDNTPPALTRI